MSSECDKCVSAGRCIRHPNIDKSGVFLEICRGDGDPSVRQRWIDKWDAENRGTEYVPPKLAPPPIPVASCCGTSLGSKLISVTKAAAGWLASGMAVPPTEVLEGRREICAGCEYFKDDWCLHCSCYLPAKTSMATMFCPIEKWKSWAPEMREGSAFVHTRELIPSKRKKRLVITVGVGDEFEEMLKLTGPLMKSYAERCDADFFALTQLTQHWPLYEKFRIRQWADAYEQTLFIDGDCLVKPCARDLFRMVPSGSVGIHDDIGLNRDNGWAVRAWDRIMLSQKLYRRMRQPMSILNSGVVLVDRSVSFIWEAPRLPLPGVHEDEQVWIQSTIEDRCVSVFRLERAFNEQWYTQHTEAGNYPERWHKLACEADIVHFARCPNRIEEIKKWIQKL